jgi:uncharacterized protein (TIGR02145 family)
LYNWFAVDDARNVCPAGWHVPSDVEWTALVDYLGGPLDAGGKMKAVGTAYWQDPNVLATNESGFSGVGGGGAQGVLCTFGALGTEGTCWSSTPWSTTGAWFYSLNAGYGQVGSGTQYRGTGFSVRCVRD